MKKYFLSLVAMAAMLFATSCQESLVEPQVAGTTTFTVQVPDQMGTKALGLAANVNQLFVAVYADASATNATPIYRAVAPVSNGQATVSLNLIQDQFYDVIFWAQVGDNYVSADKTNDAYTFDLVNIPMNKNYHNTDAGAAFFYYWDNFQPTGTSQPVTLRRPFAQLNLGTTSASLETNAGNFTLVSSKIEVKGIADNFNTVSGFGTVTEANKDKVYTFIAVEDSQVSTPLPSDATINVAGVDYKYVSMDYLPIVGDDQALITVDATITLNNSQSIKHKFTNVPVRENYRTNIVGNLISSSTDFNVVVDDRFVDENGDNVSDDNNILVVENAAAAQAALDNAKPGDVIELVAGVNYGILYLRPVKDSPATKEVDWIGNNYRWETYTLFENITILGAEGATVDAIKIEGGTYYNTEHSQMDKYPVMLSLIELKNVVIDGVTFTGKGGYDPQGYGNAINLSGRNIKVDGLTLKNCVLDNPSNNARLIYKTESTTAEHKYTYDSQTYTFTPSLKDITVTGTTFNGGYMGLELRETENVTITNNEFNVGDRNILLPSNSGCTYSGNVTITGNVSNNAKERFVRMSGAGDAEVVIKNNIINNYQGADADYIKVTGSNDETNLVTIENNQRGYYVTPETLSSTNFNDGGIFYLKGDFSEVLSINITPTEGVVATIDASEAEFGDIIKLMIPSQPDNNNVISRELGRKGNYTFNGFKGTTVGLGAYGANVTITNSELDAIDVYAANISLDINNNKIDSDYEMHPRVAGGQTDYAANLMMISYDLKFDYNIVSKPIGHAVAINGLVATFDSDRSEINNPAWASKVSSFTNNTINGIGGSTKNNRAGFKVWDDLTYAPTNVNQFELLPPAGQGLINYVESNLAQNKFVKAESTSNNAYKICFYEYYHESL